MREIAGEGLIKLIIVQWSSAQSEDIGKAAAVMVQPSNGRQLHLEKPSGNILPHLCIH